MKTLTAGTRRATSQRREQTMHHVGPAGLRRFARAVLEYDVRETTESATDDGLWWAGFVAGDLLRIEAGQPGGSPVEIAILDDRHHPIVLSKCPGGVCRAGAKVPRSGMYAVRVRSIRRAHGRAPGLARGSRDSVAGVLESNLPFKLSRTRQMPRRLRAHMAPRRRRAHPRFVTSPSRRLFAQLVARIGALCERLPHRSHSGTPAAA